MQRSFFCLPWLYAKMALFLQPTYTSLPVVGRWVQKGCWFLRTESKVAAIPEEMVRQLKPMGIVWYFVRDGWARVPFLNRCRCRWFPVVNDFCSRSTHFLRTINLTIEFPLGAEDAVENNRKAGDVVFGYDSWAWFVFLPSNKRELSVGGWNTAVSCYFHPLFRMK